MRLVNFESETFEIGVGIELPEAEEVVDLVATDPKIPSTMREILATAPTSIDRIAEVLERGKYVTATYRRLLAPILHPGKVIGIGLNYSDHAQETGAAIPTEPIVFSKFGNTVAGPGDTILLPSISSKVDYEAELVVVIGKKGRNIPREQALSHVAGYTAGHDVSARDWQLEKGAKQWLLGKTFDTFAPIGPVLVTADEIPNPQDLKIQFRLNGETMQNGTTGKMIFGVDELIAYLSQVMTLEPGDIIFTGTPPGVGMARNPQIFLKDGDVCEVEVEKIGVLKNVCKAG